jgi:5'(3')-deoxyribonucleotidase
MRILLDMDGVLADFDAQLWDETRLTVAWPEEAFLRGRRFCTDYLSSNADRALIRRHIESTGFFWRLPVIAGAQEGVAALEDAGADVWVVSKPLTASESCASDKYSWVAEHFPSLREKVILAPNKSLVQGTILLDDAIKDREEEVAEWAAVHYSYAHNLDKVGYKFTWAEGADRLLKIAEDSVLRRESRLGIRREW